MATSSNSIPRGSWENLSRRLGVKKEEMNSGVMDFLVAEGYADVAEKFQMETGTVPQIDFAMITNRMALIKDVQCGNVEGIIEKVNDLNPELLNRIPVLLFRLQQQTFIELIRHEKIEMALEIAQMQLAPIGEENESLLGELERTLSLLAFEDVSECPVGELLEDSQRLKTASELNRAILISQHLGIDRTLRLSLQKLMWVQAQLDGKLPYPRINNIWSARLEDPAV